MLEEKRVQVEPHVQSALRSIGSVKRAIRWTDWALSKIPLLCWAGSYLCLFHHQVSWQCAAKMCLFIYVFAVSNAGFGFLINDLGDRTVDRLAGKRNIFNESGMKAGLISLGALLCVMVASACPFILQPGFPFLWALSLLACIAYSLPPLRLKQRGFSGIAVSVVAQSTLPLLLLCSAMGFAIGLESILLICVGSISACTLEIAHQRYDRPSDEGTETSTFAVQLGSNGIDTAYRVILVVDRLAVGLLITLVAVRGLYSLPLGWIGLLLIPLYLTALLVTTARMMRREQIDPWYGSRPWDQRLIHNVLPNICVPITLLVCLSQFSPAWLVLLICFICWRLLLYMGQT